MNTKNTNRHGQVRGPYPDTPLPLANRPANVFLGPRKSRPGPNLLRLSICPRPSNERAGSLCVGRPRAKQGPEPPTTPGHEPGQVATKQPIDLPVHRPNPPQRQTYPWSHPPDRGARRRDRGRITARLCQSGECLLPCPPGYQPVQPQSLRHTDKGPIGTSNVLSKVLPTQRGQLRDS
jgi:hypothetical protein